MDGEHAGGTMTGMTATGKNKPTKKTRHGKPSGGTAKPELAAAGSETATVAASTWPALGSGDGAGELYGGTLAGPGGHSPLITSGPPMTVAGGLPPAPGPLPGPGPGAVPGPLPGPTAVATTWTAHELTPPSTPQGPQAEAIRSKDWRVWRATLVNVAPVRGRAVGDLADWLLRSRHELGTLAAVSLSVDLLSAETEDTCAAVTALLADGWHEPLGQLLHVARAVCTDHR